MSTLKKDRASVRNVGKGSNLSIHWYKRSPHSIGTMVTTIKMSRSLQAKARISGTYNSFIIFCPDHTLHIAQCMTEMTWSHAI